MSAGKQEIFTATVRDGRDHDRSLAGWAEVIKRSGQQAQAMGAWTESLRDELQSPRETAQRFTLTVRFPGWGTRAEYGEAELAEELGTLAKLLGGLSLRETITIERIS
jgi:hypothetical protein